MGFCFINNIAVGAAYARAVYNVERIFILDWDVHHGNGTQDIFEEDPFTYFCSFHEHPTFCFPGTGRRMERGKGPGQGSRSPAAGRKGRSLPQAVGCSRPHRQARGTHP